jgi:phosphonate transport system ATP-binding protein
MLAIQGLRKQYPGESDPALNGINLTIKQGELVAVLGRSGAGKSTLIRCINRLVTPDQGSIQWNGQNVTGTTEKELRKLRGEIGMIFQHFHLLPRLSVLTNVLVGQFASMPLWRSVTWSFTSKQKEEAMEALRQVGLELLARRRVEELSGGQQQRVAIARVMMQRPKLLLGDEPVSSLDPVTAVKVLDLVKVLHREQGMTVLLNLHDVSLAKRYAGRLIGLAKGGIVFDGPPEELTEEALTRIYPQDEPQLTEQEMKIDEHANR